MHGPVGFEEERRDRVQLRLVTLDERYEARLGMFEHNKLMKYTIKFVLPITLAAASFGLSFYFLALEGGVYFDIVTTNDIESCAIDVSKLFYLTDDSTRTMTYALVVLTFAELFFEIISLICYCTVREHKQVGKNAAGAYSAADAIEDGLEAL